MAITNSALDIIVTERLILRKFVMTDANDMLKNWIADPEIQSRYGEPIFTKKQDVINLIDKWALQYRWAIILRESNENIGHISFCRVYEKDNTAEMEYCIGKLFWNSGFATEAIKAVIEYTFKNTPIKKLEAFHRIANPASGRVLQKAGMKKADNVLRYREFAKAPECNIYYSICAL